MPEWKPQSTFTGHSAAVYAVASGRSDNTFFSASGDRFVAEWNSATGQQESFAVMLETPAYAVCFIPEYYLLLVGNSLGGLHVIDTQSRKEVRYLVQHRQGIYDIAWDASRNQVLVAGGDGVLSVWEAPTIDLMVALPLSDEKLRQIAFNPSHDSLAVACGDGVIRMLDPVFFNEVKMNGRHAEGATSVVFHIGKPVLLSGGKDAHLRVHGLKSHEELLNLPVHQFSVYSMVFSPDGKWLATGSRDKTIKIWDARTMDPITRLDASVGGHTHSVNKLLWMPDGTLISCSDDRKIISWRMQ